MGPSLDIHYSPSIDGLAKASFIRAFKGVNFGEFLMITILNITLISKPK
jgi:hypothetical protein